MEATSTETRRRTVREEVEETSSTVVEPVTIPGGFTDAYRSAMWVTGVFVLTALASAGTAYLVRRLGLSSAPMFGDPSSFTNIMVVLGGAWWVAAAMWAKREWSSTTTFTAEGVVSSGFTGLHMRPPKTVFIRGDPNGRVRLVARKQVIHKWRAELGGFDADSELASRIASAMNAKLVDERDANEWERYANDPTYRATLRLQRKKMARPPPKPVRATTDLSGMSMWIDSAEFGSSSREVRITTTHLIVKGRQFPLGEIGTVGVIRQRGDNSTKLTLKVSYQGKIKSVFHIYETIWKPRAAQMQWIADQIEEALENAAYVETGDRRDVPTELRSMRQSPD